MKYDVVVIGAGVVGCAIARELSRYDISVALVDRNSDVGTETSKANTAILHTGFDSTPGSLESKLVSRGYYLLKDYCSERNISVEHRGGLLIAWNEEQKAKFSELIEKANQNGISKVSLVESSELYALEPHLGAGALGAIRIDDESIVDPFSPVISFAYEAVENGVVFLPRFDVQRISREADSFTLSSASYEIQARWVINAAGLGSDRMDQMMGFQRFRITPRRGELIVYDKQASRLVNHILLPVPTKVTKGLLVSPTVFGNVLLGPTAEDLKEVDRNTSVAGLQSLVSKGASIIPKLIFEEVTNSYAGLRAATQHSDYQIYFDDHYTCVGGIRSTGLSASLAIAKYVVEEIGSQLQLQKPKEILPIEMFPLGEFGERPFLNQNLIDKDPNFGRVICFCEKTTLGELLAAKNAPIPAGNIDGLRRRTRCLQGRCQGFYCQANIEEFLQNEGTVL